MCVDISGSLGRDSRIGSLHTGNLYLDCLGGGLPAKWDIDVDGIII